MNEPIKYTVGAPLVAPPRNRSAREVIRQVHVTALRVQGEAALTRLAMDEALGVDDHRRRLLDGDEDRAAILMRLEVGFVNRVERVLQNASSPFGF